MIVLMEDILISCTLGLFGLILGSYAAATVWRLRARQLAEDKAAGEVVDAKEYKRLLPLTKETLKTDRSRCLACSHSLSWIDLLPLVSWLGLKGKCRYCQAPIGWFEPMMELGVAALFVVSYLVWPLPLDGWLAVAQLVLWLIAVVMLAILCAYDLKWFLLPNQVMFPLIGIGILAALLQIVAAPDAVTAALNSCLAVTVLSGLYLLLWVVSKGAWIGFGDVKLGLALALLLGDWRLALLTLFSANLIGCLLVIPGLATGKIDRSARIPFGPLLIVGCVLSLLFGAPIIDWYTGLVTIL